MLILAIQKVGLKNIVTLKIDDFYDDEYTLIGIHTTIEDYRIAFLLNNFLQTTFKKEKEGLPIFQNGVEGNHSVYLYQDQKFKNDWYLIANSCNVKQKSIGLFEESEIKTYLIPEKKKIDYFIKIYGYYEEDFVEKINTIPQVITSYLIDSETLKSKNNLIF